MIGTTPKKKEFESDGICSRCKTHEQNMIRILGNHDTDYELCEACYEQYQRRWDIFIDRYIKEGEEFRDLIISEIDKGIRKFNENHPDYFVSWDKEVVIKKITRSKDK